MMHDESPARPSQDGDGAHVKDYRSAIERELADRLAQGPTSVTAGLAATPGAGQGTPPCPAPGVSLLCLRCRRTSAGDAHFCTSCGERFNALVVVPRG